MKQIPLTGGRVALVDDEDFEFISKHKWHANTHTYSRHLIYAKTRFHTKILLMHRLIMGAKEGENIDHINGNGLDNRRCNLRIATHSQNGANQRARKGGTSRYKGVFWHKRDKRWVAKITSNKQIIHLGNFANEIKAAKTYDINAVLLFGEFARLNFPVEGKG